MCIQRAHHLGKAQGFSNEMPRRKQVQLLQSYKKGRNLALSRFDLRLMLAARKPEIWLGKVMKVDLETKGTVLAELVEEEANCYEVKVGSSVLNHYLV